MSTLALKVNPYDLSYLAGKIKQNKEGSQSRNINSSTKRKLSIYSLSEADIDEIISETEALIDTVKNHWSETSLEKQESIKGLFPGLFKTQKTVEAKNFSLTKWISKQLLRFKFSLVITNLEKEKLDKLDKLVSVVITLERELLEKLQCEHIRSTITTNTWLKNNSEALALVNKGLEEASSGKGEYLGSFAKYIDLEDEDETD